MFNVNSHTSFSSGCARGTARVMIKDSVIDKDISPLTTTLISISNSTHTFKKMCRTTTGSITDYLSQAKQWLWKKKPERNNDYGGRIEICEILNDGEFLRREAESLLSSSKEKSESQGRTDCLLKCPLFVALLVMSGVTGTVCYRYYAAKKGYNEAQGNATMPVATATPPNTTVIHKVYGGNLDGKFGYPVLNHYEFVNNTRHSRSHLPVTAGNKDNARAEELNIKNLPSIISSGYFDNDRIVKKLATASNDLYQIDEKINLNKKEMERINNLIFRRRYQGIDPDIIRVEMYRRERFYEERTAKNNKLNNEIRDLKNERKTNSDVLRAILGDALVWCLKKQENKNEINNQRLYQNGESIKINGDLYIYLFGAPWLITSTDTNGTLMISKDKSSTKILIEKLDDDFILSRKLIDTEISQYLNSVKREKKNHDKNLLEINGLLNKKPSIYLPNRLKVEIKTNKGRMPLGKANVYFNLNDMITNISGDDKYLFKELLYMVSRSDAQQPSPVVEKEKSLSVEHILTLLELIRQYSNSEVATDKSKKSALILSDKIKEVTKNLYYDKDKMIYNCIDDYMFILSETEKIQPTNEIYDEAMNAFFYHVPDPLTREVNALNKQKIILYKLISAKRRIEEKQIDISGPRKQLSMNSRGRTAEKNMPDEIYRLENKITLIDEKIKALKKDSQSIKQYEEINHFIERLYDIKINENIMQEFGSEILLFKNKSIEDETAYYISRAKSRHIQELLNQARLYEKLFGLFRKEDFQIKMSRHDDYRDIENARKLASRFISETVNIDSRDSVNIHAIFYFILKYSVNNVEELSEANPQHIYFNYISDSRTLHPLKVDEMMESYILRDEFFFREQFNSQKEFNEQFQAYKCHYAHHEASAISRMLYSTISDKLEVNTLYEKPKWIKEFSFIKNAIDAIYVIALIDGRFITISYIDNIFVVRVTTSEVMPYFFMNDPLGVLNKKNPRIDGILPALDVNILFFDKNDLEKFQMEFTEFMKNVQNVSFSDKIKVQHDEFQADNKNIANLLVSVVEKSIISFSEQKKIELDKSGIIHNFASSVVPFYGIIYKSINDSGHKWTFKDTLSIMNDAIMLIYTCIGSGQKISKTLAERIVNLSIENQSSKRIAYSNFINASKNLKFIKANVNIISTDMVDFFLNPLPFSINNLFSFIKVKPRGNKDVNKMVRIDTKYAVNDDISNKHDAEFFHLSPMMNDGYHDHETVFFNGIFENNSDGNYYIFSDSKYYQVRWSESEEVWRIVDPNNSRRLHWTPAVLWDEKKGWNMYQDSNRPNILNGGQPNEINGIHPLRNFDNDLHTHAEKNKFDKLTKNEKLKESIKLLKSKDGQYEYFFDDDNSSKRLNVVGHGKRNSMIFKGDISTAKEFTPEELATLLLPYIKNKNVRSLRLLSCWSGKSGFAQKLANYLAMPVKAPMGKVVVLDVMPGRVWFLQRPFNAAYPDQHEWKIFEPEVLDIEKSVRPISAGGQGFF